MSLEKALRGLINAHSRGQVEIVRSVAVGEAVKYMTGPEALLWVAKCIEETCDKMDLAYEDAGKGTIQ